MTRLLPALFIAALLAGCAKEPAPTEAAQDAQPTQAAELNVFAFKIGELSAYALRDGGFTFPNDNQIVGVGRTPEDVAELLSAAGVSITELSLSVQPLLVQAGDKVLLFDAGAGANMGEGNGKLLESMKQANIDPTSVTDIFISHSHGDHIGGLVGSDGALSFPNATIHISAPEWEYLRSWEEKQNDTQAALIEAIAPKVKAFEPGSELVPGLVTAVAIDGHTPGHSGYRITSGSESLLYIGDTAHHYIVSVQRPEWTISFDHDAPTAQTSRRELIERSAASSERIYAVHFPFPGLGKFSASGEGFVWTPEH